ncbi:hypothetical protein E2C01_071876 [Portunus trituberculatus]|uniref:Uncharacterized protein n=1 Tax=Portunus trituberculatus TaxID=210409 RepID=A0A5B7I520_PORTR|nr:hypothetical protein [Portunus trituberculatus]
MNYQTRNEKEKEKNKLEYFTANILLSDSTTERLALPFIFPPTFASRPFIEAQVVRSTGVCGPLDDI